jgi:hypothetical protein
MMHHGLQAMLWRRAPQLELEVDGSGRPETEREREHGFDPVVRGTEDGSRCRPAESAAAPQVVFSSRSLISPPSSLWRGGC